MHNTTIKSVIRLLVLLAVASVASQPASAVTMFGDNGPERPRRAAASPLNKDTSCRFTCTRRAQSIVGTAVRAFVAPERRCTPKPFTAKSAFTAWAHIGPARVAAE